MLLSGFEPESSPRKGEMIGRTTPQEHYVFFFSVAPRGFEPLLLALEANMIDRYTTGLHLRVLVGHYNFPILTFQMRKPFK